MSLFSLSDDQIIAEAARIASERKDQAIRHNTEEIKRLYKKYASGRDKHPHALGKPLRLEPMEALLLVALERNKFVVEAHLGGLWFGDAYCKYNLRSGAMASGVSRLDLLMGLWQLVSNQEGDAVMLTEEHLNGSVAQSDIRQLNTEVREQDKREQSSAMGMGVCTMSCCLCNAPLSGGLDTFGNFGEETCINCYLFFVTHQVETKLFQEFATQTGMSKMGFLSQLIDTPLGLIARGRTDLV